MLAMLVIGGVSAGGVFWRGASGFDEVLRKGALRTLSELRDEKVVLSAQYLPAGTYVYTYLARASTAGRKSRTFQGTFRAFEPRCDRAGILLSGSRRA